jgi:hypothetical protein
VISSLLNIAYLASSTLLALVAFMDRVGRDAVKWLWLALGVLLIGSSRYTRGGVWADDYLQHSINNWGLYGHRRMFQLLGILSVALILSVAFLRLGRSVERAPLKSALWAFYALAVFAAVRVSSWRWSDAFLQRQIGPLRLSHAAQILPLFAISTAALFELRHVASEKQGIRRDRSKAAFEDPQ